MSPFRRFESINLNPVIGVMLLLLVMVWSALTLVSTSKIELTLPVKRTEASVASVDPVEISVQRDGSFLINDFAYSLHKAQLQLKLLSTDTPILLLTNESVDFQHIVDIIDILKSFSLESVSILMHNDI